MNTCELIIFITIISINVLILNYVIKLEKVSCECSKDWKRDYIKYFAIITIIVMSLMTIIPLLTNRYITLIQTPFFRILSGLFSIATLVNIYALFTYSQQIVLSTCKCSKSWERTFIYYYSMVIMSVYIFIITSIILLSLCVGNVTKFKKLLNK